LIAECASVVEAANLAVCAIDSQSEFELCDSRPGRALRFTTRSLLWLSDVMPSCVANCSRLISTCFDKASLDCSALHAQSGGCGTACRQHRDVNGAPHRLPSEGADSSYSWRRSSTSWLMQCASLNRPGATASCFCTQLSTGMHRRIGDAAQKKWMRWRITKGPSYDAGPHSGNKGP